MLWFVANCQHNGSFLQFSIFYSYFPYFNVFSMQTWCGAARCSKLPFDCSHPTLCFSRPSTFNPSRYLVSLIVVHGNWLSLQCHCGGWRWFDIECFRRVSHHLGLWLKVEPATDFQLKSLPVSSRWKFCSSNTCRNTEQHHTRSLLDLVSVCCCCIHENFINLSTKFEFSEINPWIFVI